MFEAKRDQTSEIIFADLQFQFNRIKISYDIVNNYSSKSNVFLFINTFQVIYCIFQVTFTTSYIVSKLTLKNPIVKIFIKKSSNGSIIFTLNSNFLITNLIVRCIDIFIQIN